MADLLVSIILTTWNRAALLPRAIASVQAQTYEHWELIVVDDGSTDETGQLLASISASDKRIHTFHHPNMGPARSRNAGMRLAKGDIVTFLDSDDEYAPEHLAIRVKLFLDDAAVRFVHGGVRVIGDAQLLSVPDLDDPSRMIPLSECAIGGSFFSRRGIIEAAGGWRDGYGEDADLLKRIRSITPVTRVNNPTYIYHRETTDSRCTTVNGLRSGD